MRILHVMAFVGFLLYFIAALLSHAWSWAVPFGLSATLNLVAAKYEAEKTWQN